MKGHKRDPAEIRAALVDVSLAESFWRAVGARLGVSESGARQLAVRHGVDYAAAMAAHKRLVCECGKPSHAIGKCHACYARQRRQAMSPRQKWLYSKRRARWYARHRETANGST